MGLETFEFIPDLVDTNPEPTDPVAQGDDHIRGLKFTLQTQWPVIGQNAITRTAEQMNDAALRSETNTFTERNIFANALTDFDAGAGVDTTLRFLPGGVRDWELTNQASVGSDFILSRYVAGVFADIPFSIANADGRLTFEQQVLGKVGDEASPSYSFQGEPSTGVYLATPGTIGYTTLGALTMSLQAAGNAGIFAGTGVAFQADGTALATKPGFTFSNDNDTGVYRPAGNELGFVTGAVERMRVTNTGIPATVSFLQRDGSLTNPSYAFENEVNTGMFRPAANSLSLVTNSLEALRIDVAQQTTVRKECTVQRNNDTQARTGWRYTQTNGVPMWAIYAGTSPTNTLAFQRYDAAGAFQDIPLSIRQLNGLIRMSTLPSSSAGLIAGELWRNPISPGFVAIV